MQRPANEVMQSVIFSAVLDAVEALRKASGGLPNQMVRDLQSIHGNVTFADLPKELQDAIIESTRGAFTKLLKEGYAVGPRQQMQQSRPLDRVPERDRRGPRGPGEGHRRGGRPPRGGGPGRGPGGGSDKPERWSRQAGRWTQSAAPQAEGQAPPELISPACAATAPPSFSTGHDWSTSRDEECTPADEVSSAGVLCVLSSRQAGRGGRRGDVRRRKMRCAFLHGSLRHVWEK